MTDPLIKEAVSTFLGEGRMSHSEKTRLINSLRKFRNAFVVKQSQRDIQDAISALNDGYTEGAVEILKRIQKRDAHVPAVRDSIQSYVLSNYIDILDGRGRTDILWKEIEKAFVRIGI